jgi:hypothetical protein
MFNGSYCFEIELGRCPTESPQNHTYLHEYQDNGSEPAAVEALCDPVVTQTQLIPAILPSNISAGGIASCVPTSIKRGMLQS